MEEYNNNHLSENTGPSPSPRPNFLYSSSASGNHQSHHQHHHHHHHHHHDHDHHHRQQHQLPINTFHLQSGGSDHCFQSDQVPHPAVKTEASTSQLLHTPIFHYPLMRGNLQHTTMQHQSQQQGGGGHPPSSSEVEAIKAKIIAHPQYSTLLEAYMDCQKVTPQTN